MTNDRISVQAFPLEWPDGWKRTAFPTASKFGRGKVYTLTPYSAAQAVLGELARLGAKRPVISSNLRVRADGVPYSGQRQPQDAGVAVYFELDAQPRVLACDRWQRVEENLRAIALHIEAVRGQERWGVGTVAQAFAGYAALPERAGGRAWWEVLDVPPDADPEKIERAYKQRAHECHPDKGGSPEAWHELQDARSQALAAKRG